MDRRIAEVERMDADVQLDARVREAARTPPHSGLSTGFQHAKSQNIYVRNIDFWPWDMFFR